MRLILTAQSDNTHMVRCYKVHLYHLVLGYTGKKQRKNGRIGGRRGETGSRNMAATPKTERALVISYRQSIVTFALT